VSGVGHAGAPATSADGGALLAGIDIGGTTTQAVLCDSALRVVARAETSTPARVSGDAMAGAAVRLVRGLVEQTGAPLRGVGIGAAGVVDAARGRVLVASSSFVGWAGFPVASIIADQLAAPTFLDNDVNAFLRGELTAGSIVGERDALGITLGTGVGGALWLDGELWDGPRGAAGEIGHIPGFGEDPCTCGGRGHLETRASGASIARRYTQRTGRAADARMVCQFAAGGDGEALAVLEQAAQAVARGVLIAAGLLDVTTVVVGGGVSGSWPTLGPLVRTALAAEPPVSGASVRIEVSSLGADAVALGAVARAQAELSAR